LTLDGLRRLSPHARTWYKNGIVAPAGIYERLESTLLSSTHEEPLLRPVMPELDTIRGAAVLMVLVYHAFYRNDMAMLPRMTRLFVYATWPGRFGVNLFFVLSGFLITGLLLDSVHRPDYFKRFYVRRALRILPAYYLILVILAVTHHASRAFLGLSAIYLANLTPLFGVARSYVVLWSLAVEEHFYLIWPGVVRRLATRTLMACAAGVLILLPMARAAGFLTTTASNWSSINGYTWYAADGLVLGSLLVLAIRQYRWSRRTALRYALLAIFGGAGLLCAGLPFGIASREGSLLGAALQDVPFYFAFAGFVSLFLVLGTGRWKFLVLPASMRFLGRISYGLYLVHVLLFDAYDAVVSRYIPRLDATSGQLKLLWIRFLIGSAAAILVAWVSRETFEEFFLSRKEDWSAAKIPAAAQLQ
jgi:peptidoglycan/LPS O-acetylase OafA/YrhL